jgi:hypothetical protein
VDRPTVDKLIGAGQTFGAETCLFVSWGGFKPNVQKELARDFIGSGWLPSRKNEVQAFVLT